MAETNFYPKTTHDIDIPNVFEPSADLDTELVHGLSEKVIGAVTEAEEQARMDQYHLKRLAEQAEGMSRDEALTMCRHFDETILIEALHWHAQLNNKFKRQVIAASKEALAEMEK